MADNITNPYVNSDKIQVFPYSQNRGNYQKNNRVLNEQNLTNLIKKLAGKDPCVLRRSDSTGQSPNTYYEWEILLGGRWFSFDYTTDPKNLYAYIVVDDQGQLLGGDKDGEFKGLSLVTSVETLDKTQSVDEQTGTVIYLELLNNGKVPESSWFRFTSDSISMGDNSSLERRLSWQAAPKQTTQNNS